MMTLALHCLNVWKLFLMRRVVFAVTMAQIITKLKHTNAIAPGITLGGRQKDSNILIKQPKSAD